MNRVDECYSWLQEKTVYKCRLISLFVVTAMYEAVPKVVGSWSDLALESSYWFSDKWIEAVLKEDVLYDNIEKVI